MIHQPVMLAEVLAWLAPRAGGALADFTAGAGGHLRAILEALKPSRMLAVDRDARNMTLLSPLQNEHGQLQLQCGDFLEVLRGLPSGSLDGILLDLGYHSGQLETVSGLSYDRPGALDMRLSEGVGPSAADLLVRADEAELAFWLAEYGEEPHARRIARLIKKELPALDEITSQWLVALIRRYDPNPPRASGKIRRVFQALRIVVNNELETLSLALEQSLRVLGEKGRLLVITFHSLEDRLVKLAFKDFQSRELGRILSKKAVKPSKEETSLNPRAKSALLRIFEKDTPSSPISEQERPL